MKNGLVVVLLLVCVALGAGLGYGPRRGAPVAGAGAPPVAPTATLEATATPSPSPTEPPTATPTLAPPSATPTPQPSPTATRPPAPTATAQTLPHGVLGRLRLRDSRTEYAVSEAVFFVSELENRTAGAVPFGILGLSTGPGGSFYTGATSGQVEAQSVLTTEHQVTFAAPGTYTVTLAACFSPTEACAGGGSAEWEEFPSGVVVTVR